jgi:hypothetical protein
MDAILHRISRCWTSAIEDATTRRFSGRSRPRCCWQPSLEKPGVLAHSCNNAAEVKGHECEGILPVHGAPARDRLHMVRLITNGRSRNESSDESLRNIRYIMMGGGHAGAGIVVRH